MILYRLPTISLLTGMLAACSWTVDMREGQGGPAETRAESNEEILVSGQLSYPERIALPSDGQMLVVVQAVDQEGPRPIAGYRMALDGSQVPLPFGLGFRPETGRPVVHELIAQVRHDDRLLRQTDPVLLGTDPASIELGQIHLEAVEATDFGQAWRCGSHRVRFDPLGERPRLAIDERIFDLEQVPAASGVRHQVPGNAGIGVHEKGGDFLVVHGGARLPDCREAAAPELPLTALGHEPAWQLRIDETSLRLTTDYGESVIEMPRLYTGRRGWTTRYRGADAEGGLIATLRERVCRDSATGMPHPFEAEVLTGLETFTGCGGNPAELLAGGRWRIERIDEVPIETEAELFFEFTDDGQVRGRAGCNQFTADYRLTGERLTIEDPARTLMACRDPLMVLEQRILERLATVERFEIDERGGLGLIGRQGRIDAVRPAP